MTKKELSIVAALVFIVVVGLGALLSHQTAPLPVVSSAPQWCTAWCSGRGGVESSATDKSRSGTRWGTLCGCQSGAEAELP
jgi:hypothetical protein